VLYTSRVTIPPPVSANKRPSIPWADLSELIFEELPESVEINEGRGWSEEPGLSISRIQSRGVLERGGLGAENLRKMVGSGRVTGVRNRKVAITNFQTFTLIHGLSARSRRWLRRNPRLSQWLSRSKTFRQTRSLRRAEQNPGNQRGRRFFSSLSQTSPRNLAHPPKPLQKLKTSGPGPRSQIHRPVHTPRSSQKTDGTFSSHPIIFQGTLNVSHQIFLFHRRIIHKNTRLFHGSCCFNLVRHNPWWLHVALRWRTYRKDHVCTLESAQPVPAHHCFPRRLHKILGLPRWHTSPNYSTPSANIHDHG